MSELGEFRCQNCNMVFRSPGLLEKHRKHFCIGSDIGDPFLLHRRYAESLEKDERNRYSWRGREPLRTQTPDFIRFHRLRVSLEESMPTLPTWAERAERDHANTWAQPGPSMSPRRNWEHMERVREVAETHGRHLADIQARNHELELQREEIQQRLSELSAKDSAAGHIEGMLQELRAQEERNEWALHELREQIEALHGQQGTKAAPPQAETTNPIILQGKKEQHQHISFDFIASGDGPLSTQIRALRLAYMQSGGADPAILAQMHDLQAEAHTLERAGPKAEHRQKKRRGEFRPQGLDSELLAVERENQRLEEEILRLQLNRERRGEEEATGAALLEMQGEHVRQVAAVQREIESLRRDLERAPRCGGPPPPPPPPPLLLPPTLRAPGRLGHPLAPPVTEAARPQTPLIGTHVLDPLEALGPAPYDPEAGFVIFYDFILGLEPTLRMARLVVGLYSGGQKMGRPSPLPVVYCEAGGALPYVTGGHQGNIATLSVKQPVPRVHPSPSINLVVELQAAGGFNAYGQEVHRLLSRGWARLDLFDQHNRVLSGFWKVPFRALPLGGAELYLRVVNARDGDVQALARIDPGYASQYKYPSLVAIRPVAHVESPPTVLTSFHPSANHYLSLPPPTDHVDPPPPMEGSSQSVAETPAGPGPSGGVGFIVDRVKGAPLGFGSLRLTGYSQRTGKVIVCRSRGILCFTSTVSSSIKHGDFIFGEQEILFSSLRPEADMVLFVRFYHWPSGSSLTGEAPRGPKKEEEGVSGSLAEREECIVAWGVLRLTRPAARPQKSPGRGKEVWNTGTHSVPLFHVPAPPALALNALPAERLVEPFEPYGDTSVRLHIYSGDRPQSPFPPESPIHLFAPQDWPQVAYINCKRELPPARPFLSGDGLDLYLDGARFLPDGVTISRVTGRIFDRHYNQVGPEISTGIDLDSNIFEPVYGERVEIRSPSLPPSATLLLKVYTVDRFTLKLVLIGWAALGLFVESGSETQPNLDTAGLQISLNEGGHQLRLYHNGPDPDKPLSTSALSTQGRYVPCATLLVRLVRAPVDNNGQTLMRSTVPEADWERLGLFLPRPGYSDGGYYSHSAKPSQGEACLLSAMSNRSVVLVREIVFLIAGSQGAELKSDTEIHGWIRQKLSRMIDSKPLPFNLSLVSRYLSSFGVKVSLDRGLNLPWSAFTLALCSFTPPGAFYRGASWVKYDKPAVFQELDFNSGQSAPQWLDGFKCFPRRRHHPQLTVIIHLHEVSVKVQSETLTYSLGGQAWAALPVFTQGYCNTDRYQIPLYQGAPSQDVLKALAQGDCHSILEDLRQKNQVQLLRGASVFVRIADGRRDEELALCGDKDTNLSQLPSAQRDFYSPQPSKAPLSQLIPPAYLWDQFSHQLSARFKQLIYQSLETGSKETGPLRLHLGQEESSD
nr:PREDICTED: coiled-coil domain-containing protein 17 [Lepisosteus oculatus]